VGGFANWRKLEFDGLLADLPTTFSGLREFTCERPLSGR
jgi:hypothetical protein